MHFKSPGSKNEEVSLLEITFRTQLFQLMEIAFGNFFFLIFLFQSLHHPPPTPLTFDTLLLLLAAAAVLNCEFHKNSAYIRWENERENKIQDIRCIERNAVRSSHRGVRTTRNFRLQ